MASCPTARPRRSAIEAGPLLRKGDAQVTFPNARASEHRLTGKVSSGRAPRARGHEEPTDPFVLPDPCDFVGRTPHAPRHLRDAPRRQGVNVFKVSRLLGHHDAAFTW